MNLFNAKKFASQNAAAAAEAAQKRNFCDVYKIARPILSFLSTFFIIPGKIRQIIVSLIAVADMQCPQASRRINPLYPVKEAD